MASNNNVFNESNQLFVCEAPQSRFTKVNQDINPQVMKINSSKMQKARFLPKAVQDNNLPGIEQNSSQK